MEPKKSFESLPPHKKLTLNEGDVQSLPIKSYKHSLNDNMTVFI